MIDLKSVVNRQRFVLGSSTPGEDVPSQLDPVTVDIPADATMVVAHLTATGHKGLGVLKNCAANGAVCPLRTDIHVNGEVHSVFTRRDDCSNSHFLPIRGE